MQYTSIKTWLKPFSLLVKSKRLLFGTLSLLLFLSSYWSWLDYRNFIKTPIEFSVSEQNFVINKGTGINKLASELSQKGLIARPFYFKLLVTLNPKLNRLKAGEYRLEKSMTPEQMLNLFSQGQVIQYSFSIIEGQTAYQIIQNLKAETRLTQLSEQDQKALNLALNLDFNNIEGWLFPDTYYFSKGDSALSILKRSSLKMKAFLESEWTERAENLPYQSIYQALIMASIIEKETGIASERAQIAGVFVRRLQKRMRLQTDPTIIYGIGPSFNGDITRKDMKTPTPYNTYVIKGLPPTPIAMPSGEAIHAALHPAAGSSLYFVADGTGGHYFSESLAEHQQAVRRMLKRNKGR